jgi:hypothetical protein
MNPFFSLLSGQWLWQWSAIGVGLILEGTKPPSRLKRS